MRVFLDGYGSIGRRHHRILRDIDSDVDVDINDPGIGCHREPSGRYDVGVICVPTSEHLRSAARLVDACDLLFIEKPLHTSISQIREYRHHFSNKRVHVGCNVRYTSAVRRLASLRDEVKLARVTSMSNLLQWRADPERRAYSHHQSMGGGVLMDFIHEPDYMFSVYGLPTHVSCFQGRLYDSVTVDSDDTCVMSWKYDRLYVTFSLSYCSNDYIRRVEVLKRDMSTETIEITRDDVNESYRRQWDTILKNGPENSYDDCLQLYSKILEDA